MNPGDPLGGWSVEATCPACGAGLVHVATGDQARRAEARALARCTARSCRRYWLAVLELRDATATVREQEGRDPAEDRGNTHGTRAGYMRGCRQPCCVEAYRAYERDRWQARKDRRNAERRAS